MRLNISELQLVKSFIQRCAMNDNLAMLRVKCLDCEDQEEGWTKNLWRQLASHSLWIFKHKILGSEMINYFLGSLHYGMK